MTKTRTYGACAIEKAGLVVSKRAQPLHPVVQQITENLAQIDAVRFARVTLGFSFRRPAKYVEHGCFPLPSLAIPRVRTVSNWQLPE